LLLLAFDETTEAYSTDEANDDDANASGDASLYTCSVPVKGPSFELC